MMIDRAALVAGSIRLASGVSFLVDPLRANRLWGEPDDPGPSARLLLRSMGYRDALIGGLLLTAALRGQDTRGWFLASGGADAADLLGGMSVHHDLKRGQQIIGLGGAVVGIGVGLWGATRRRRDPARPRCGEQRDLLQIGKARSGSRWWRRSPARKARVNAAFEMRHWRRPAASWTRLRPGSYAPRHDCWLLTIPQRETRRPPGTRAHGRVPPGPRAFAKAFVCAV